MATSESQDMTFTLLINSLTYPVTEKTPVMIIWQRGKTKAQTKKKLMTEADSVKEFKEKFQINTKIQVDQDGKPTEQKMSKLVVASDKARGILGQVELDLADFVGAEYKTMTLKLEKEGCSIEVSVKGTPVDKTAATKDQSLKDQIASIVDEIEQTKKNKDQVQSKNNASLAKMDEQIKQLTKKLEDTKTQIAFKCKELGTFNAKKEMQEKMINQLKEEVAAIELKTKEAEDKINESNQGLKGIEEKKANAIDQFARERKDADDKLSNAVKDKKQAQSQLDGFFNMSRFDTNFMSGKKSFPLAAKKTSQVVLNQ